MHVIYKEHEINVSRDDCVDGYPMLYWNIFRVSDDSECIRGRVASTDTVQAIVNFCKGLIDIELKEDDPWMAKAKAKAHEPAFLRINPPISGSM